MSTVQISASDVNKLRQQTGAGMMDCKKALTESNGDFEAAVDYLRKKGAKVAASRQDRESNEGVVIARASEDGKRGVIIELNCETDFVAKNAEFIAFANQIANIAIEDKPANLLVALSTNADGTEEAGKDVAMQIAAMNPVAVDKDGIDATTINRELEIAKEQIRAEGKPEEMVEKIAAGKLNKFYKDSTLLNQEFVKDSSKSVAQFLATIDKGLTVTAFKRVALGA